MRGETDDFVVHLENSYASGHRKRPRGPRSAPKVGPNNYLSVISRSPQIDLKDQALVFYLHNHLQTPKDAPSFIRSAADDLMPLLTSNVKSPMLDLAVSSMALAVFSRTQQHPEAAKQASIVYLQLLQTAQTEFLSLTRERIDICLLSIFFMSRYEDSIYRPGKAQQKSIMQVALRSFSHQKGALAMLKYWKDHLSQTQSATNVIMHTRRTAIKSALLRSVPLPEWILDGVIFGERGLDIEYDRIIIQVLDLRQRISKFLIRGANTSTENFNLRASGFYLEAEDLDRALKKWTTNFPTLWYYRQHILPDLVSYPTKEFFSPIVYTCSNPAFAGVWCKYFASRMLITSTRLRLLDADLPSSDDLALKQRLGCVSLLKSLSNDLASMVPYCLQPYNESGITSQTIRSASAHAIDTREFAQFFASVLAYPLSIAASLANVDVLQRRWFKSQIADIGRRLGAGLLECADDDDWIEI